jgi:hypothetical protein
MVSQALYASSSPTDGRRNYRTYHDPYHYSVDRRYSGSHSQSPHNSRVLNMTDNQGESDSSNQRKRISVAVSLQFPPCWEPHHPNFTVQIRKRLVRLHTFHDRYTSPLVPTPAPQTYFGSLD